MLQTYILTPAAWTKFDSDESVKQAWANGKDFRIMGSGGTYCSIRDSKTLFESWNTVCLYNPKTGKSFEVKNV